MWIKLSSRKSNCLSVNQNVTFQLSLITRVFGLKIISCKPKVLIKDASNFNPSGSSRNCTYLLVFLSIRIVLKLAQMLECHGLLQISGRMESLSFFVFWKFHKRRTTFRHIGPQFSEAIVVKKVFLPTDLYFPCFPCRLKSFSSSSEYVAFVFCWLWPLSKTGLFRSADYWAFWAPLQRGPSASRLSQTPMALLASGV